MITKMLFGACVGASCFSMLFLAPGGKVLCSSAAPEKVQRQAGATGRTGSSSRYMFVGGYYGGGK